MMRLLFFVAPLCVLLGLVSPAAAQSITVPDTVTIAGPGIVIIRASAIDADAARWWSHSAGLQTFPPDVFSPTMGTYVGFALNPGNYEVGVVVAKVVNGKAAMSLPQRIAVVVAGTPPAPPVPPAPVPPPPPSDPLAAQVQAAYAADPSATKAVDLVLLAATYTATAKQIGSIPNGNALFTVLQNARQSVIDSRLPAIRGLIGTDLQQSTLPPDGNAALTPAQQTAVANRLAYYAALLGGIR